VVIPYSFDADFIDEAARTIAIVNEVLWCFGGDPWQVHLAGTSNGGLAAFGLMTSQPEVFATLLGAPGAFPVQDPASVDPEAWAETLAGRAVFNGVGVHDQDWMPEVIATHNVLAAAGIESTYVELPGQGHALTSAFDESVFFEYWTSH
jgi:predicted esterase